MKRTRDSVMTLMLCTKALKVTQRHDFTEPRIHKFDIDEQELRCKEGIFLSESVAEQPAHWKGEFHFFVPSQLLHRVLMHSKTRIFAKNSVPETKGQEEVLNISPSTNCSGPTGEKCNDKT